MNKQLNVVRIVRIAYSVIATIAIISGVVGTSQSVIAGGSGSGPRSMRVINYTINGGSGSGPR